MPKSFDSSLADAQATAIEPIPANKFDSEAYAAYEQSKRDICKKFWQSESGVLVYRRMRVGEVFSYGSREMKNSLEWQLAALQKSMAFKADVPNFLEPWYGIGTIAAAYGFGYQWPGNQAPAVDGCFKSIDEALNQEPVPVEYTGIGKHILDMIDFFLDQTGGKVPISLTDTQSPLNSASYIVDSTSYMMDVVMNPDGFQRLLDRVADLAIGFTKTQLKLLNDVIVWPGHGFPSSPQFAGIGMSDDNMLMISGDDYMRLCAPATEKFGNAFGGPVFHSCGNWSGRVSHIKNLKNLKVVDGAFSEETDPDPNPVEPFHTFADSNIVVNARIVGDVETITAIVGKLWKPGMKLIVTTYCKTPSEQEDAYEKIHRICQN